MFGVRDQDEHYLRMYIIALLQLSRHIDFSKHEIWVITVSSVYNMSLPYAMHRANIRAILVWYVAQEFVRTFGKQMLLNSASSRATSYDTS